MPAKGVRSMSRKKSRKTAKRSPIQKRMISVSGVHSFSRFASTTVGSTGSPSYLLIHSGVSTNDYASCALTYSLDKVVNYSDFVNLFDLYKVHKVELFVSLQSPNPDNTQGSAFIAQTYYPKLWYFNDDDDEALPSLTAFRERQGVRYKVLMPNKIYKITCYPKIQTMTYRTLTSTGYQAMRPNWIDANTDFNVPHYGTKLCLDMNGQSSTGYSTVVKVEAKYHLIFKNPQ